MRHWDSIVICLIVLLTMASIDVGRTVTVRSQNSDLAAPQSLLMTVSASSPWRKDYIKFIYSYPLSFNQLNLVGLQGTISVGNNAANSFYQMLWIVGVNPTCPVSGQSFVGWEAINNTYPNLHPEYQINIKGVTNQMPTLVFPIQVSFAARVPVTGCLYMIMDFGDTAGVTTATANVSLLYDTAPAPDPAPFTVDFGGEYCYNLPSGCEVSSGKTGQTYVKTIAMKQYEQLGSYSSLRLLGLYGGMSSASVKAANGYSVTNGFYIDPACTAQGRQITGPFNHYSPPANWNEIYTVTLSGGNGWAYMNTPVSQTYDGIVLTSQNCVDWVGTMTSGTTGLDDESQVWGLVVPVISSVSSTTLRQTSTTYGTGTTMATAADTHAIASSTTGVSTVPVALMVVGAIIMVIFALHFLRGKARKSKT